MRIDEFHDQGKINNGNQIISKFKNSGNFQLSQKYIDQGQNLSDSTTQSHGDKKAYMYAPYQHLLLGILVYISTQLLVVPTFYLFSTIINCQTLEDLSTYMDDSGLIVTDFSCLSRDHLIMISASTFMALIALGFIGIETLLFQDLNMKSNLPWRQIPSRIHQFKLLKKLIIPLFNFGILTDKPIACGLFTFFQLTLLFKRFSYTRIYHINYRNWVLFSEFSIFWFSFWNFIQKVTMFQINVYTFGFLIIGGIIPYSLVMMYFFTMWKFERLFITDKHSLKELGDDIMAETYFGYLLDLIKTSKKSESDRIILFGQMRVHWYACKRKGGDQECLCNTLIQRIDRVEKAIDDEYLSKNDQFDVIKIQKQISQLENEIYKQEEKEIRNLQKNQYQSKISLNIDHLIYELRRTDTNKLNGDSGQYLDAKQSRNNLNADLFGSNQESSFNHELHANKSMNFNQTLDQQNSIRVQDSRLDNDIDDYSNDPLNDENEETVEEITRNMSEQELRKQMKILFYRHIYNMIIDAIQAFPFSFRLMYLAAYIQYYLLKNEIKGLFEILMIEKRNKVPLEWQFFLFKVKIEIEDYMDMVHKQRSSITGRIDVKKVYLFAKNLQEFEICIETISDKCLDFWKELLKKADFDANILHKVGTEITLMNMQIYNQVQNMFNINPHHGYLLRIYAIFTQKVMNNDEESEKYFKKFQNAQKTFQSYEAATLQEELVKNFSSNIKYVIVVMRVSTQETCIVEDINHEIRNVLGYKRNDILGRNIQCLMPKCVGNLHDQFVQNYLDTAKPKILNKQREVFALKKNGFLEQVFIYATVVPMIEKEGIKFVGFLKKVDEKKHTDVLPPPIEYQFKKSIQIVAAPNGSIYGINEQAYKTLGFPKYFCEESDDKHSDYNISQIIVDYNKVLYDCFKTAPIGRRAYIDTDNFKPLILPDMHSRNDIQHIKNCFGSYEVYIQACPLDFGYKGGAYLPMIIFRLYVLNKIKKEALINITQPNIGLAQKSKFKRTNTVRQKQDKVSNLKKQSLALKGLPVFNFNNQVSVRANDIQQAIEEVEDELSVDDETTKNKSPIKVIEESTAKQKEILLFLESSQSSASFSNEGKSTDMARMREFRKMVNSRKEPRTVMFLRRFVIFVTALILAIVSINTAFKINFYKGIDSLTKTSMILNDMTIQLYEIHSNFRTLININNGIQKDGIVGMVNDGQLSTKIATDLNRYLGQLNKNKNSFLESKQFLEDQINDQTENLLLKTIQSESIEDTQSVNLNLAIGQIVSKGNSLLQNQINNPRAFQNRTFISYINEVNKNNTNNASLKYQYKYGMYGNNIDQITKDLYYIHENVFDVLTNRCEEIIYKLEDIKDSYIQTQQTSFIVLVSTVLVLTVVSVSLIFYFVRQIHQTGIQSLSLYAELNIDDIQEIISDVAIFMNIIKNSSDDLNKKIREKDNNSSGNDEFEDIVFQDDYDNDQQILESQIESDQQFTRMKRRSVKSKRPKLEGQKSINDSKNSFQPLQNLNSDLINLHQNIEPDSINSSDFDSQFVSQNVTQRPSFKGQVYKQNLNFSVNIENESYSQQNSLLQESVSIDLPHDSSRTIINDPNMSSRQLASNEFKRHKTLQKKAINQKIIDEEARLRLEEENSHKVGNLEKFKMVKSNSGIRLITIILLLFSFVIILVIANFAMYVPMFQDFKKSHSQEQTMLSQYRSYYKIYMQLVQDLTEGKIGKNIPDTYLSNFNFYQAHKFSIQQQIYDMMQTHNHQSYIELPIMLLQDMNTNSYCQELQTNYDISYSHLNLTFCLTVDNKVALNQGFKIQMERMIGELQKIRIAVEDRNIDYNRFLLLFDKDQTLVKFQIMMNELFTPTFYAIRASIQTSFEKYIKLNQNTDISLLSVFVGAQLLILIIAWPRFLKNMNNQISKSRGILTLIPSRLIIANNNIKKIIEQNKLLTQ